MDQIVSQFLLKSLHIILDSRIPSLYPNDRGGYTTSASRAKKSDKWFNLALGDRPTALDNLNFWHRNLKDPMIIDIILVHEGPNSSSVDNLYTSTSTKAMVETVIERWAVHYECPRVTPNMNDSSAHKKIYKKLIVLLRSLYCQMRFLPAYRIFRQLNSSSQMYNFDIIYKVSSFSDPFSRTEEAAMEDYIFSPVEASSGRLCVSVTYRKTLSDFNLVPAASLFPRIITDYVGSPATEPLRSFPSSGKVVEATSFPLREARPPSSSPFQRPHSWTSGFHKGAPFAQVSPPVYHMYRSPSPPSDFYGQRGPYSRSVSQRAISCDDYQLSPPFSPSPSHSYSPSPPSHISGCNTSPHHGRSETSPMNIPHAAAAGNSRYSSPNLSDPNRQHSLPPPSPRNSRLDPSSQDSPSRIRSYRKSESQRSAELHFGVANHYTGHKLLRDGRDDSGRFSGLLSSSGSPRIGFSRSSSRLSLQDDSDDCEFSCPFDVDDVDNSASPARNNPDSRRSSEPSFATMGAKSQDAAVGVLVQMLRTAPPLRQDPSCYSSPSLNMELGAGVTTSSGFFLPRKTSDALEELRSFSEMKNLLLSKSGARLSKEED
ncbi:hypothetical protein MLD38_030467 [Melastoma candidum]|uniref:Uncharacterized protein n=1 Tax=Melastoma candidum TaxID=119954 RepID=A0ACB9MNA4_9MYRT|nr:hypothetical protein MLD38_030467 [Melastoma candidum]